MAKIIYKEGNEGQNKLSCIEGIEIDLLNGQKKEHTIEMKEVNENWIMTLGVQKQGIINKACKWLKENARDYACATIRCYGDEDEIICDVHQEIVEDFRKAIEE